MRIPVDKYSRISTHFGATPDPGVFGKHAGTDYACPVGTFVYAPLSGTVTQSLDGPTAGGQVEITDNTYSVRTLHMSHRNVKVGDKVSEGQQIGLSGDTGTKTTGPHCHVDVRKKGTAWNHSFADFFDFEKLIGGAMSQDATINSAAEGKELYLTALHRLPENDAAANQWNGKLWREQVQKIRQSQEWVDQNEILTVKYPALVKQLADLKNQANATELKPGIYKVGE